MVETSNKLALLRTYLALERNYLAEERTNLAELRTGLTLAVIGPSASTVFTFFITTPLLSVFAIVFFIAITLIGVWLSLRSRVRLVDIRIHAKEVRQHQKDLLATSSELHGLFADLLHLE
ncbi:MAG: DUF202 domain-containing protein [Candidatus Ranarchaeia archaeon]|jgi:uncharacterized membrane protein YidH (DUF202 family)